jgi:hypothetical protein
VVRRQTLDRWKTDRQEGKQAGRQGHGRYSSKDKDRLTEERQTGIKAGRQGRGRQSGDRLLDRRKKNRQTDRQERPTYRQTDMQKRQTDRQKEKTVNLIPVENSASKTC